MLSLEGHSDERCAMALVFHSVNKVVFSDDGSARSVLSDATSVVLPGEMLAVMGPSGSGKTTLLQILGGRNMRDARGTIMLAGEPFKKTMRKAIAFITQDDIFCPSICLTVRDHLTFAATMKLGDVGAHVREARVEEIVGEMGLESCVNSPLILVSGGERKRASIGCEIAGKPSMMLVDEGTSGLDSSAAYTLMLTLTRLAKKEQIPVRYASFYTR